MGNRVILFSPVTYLYHDTSTGVREPIFAFELELPTHTKYDANEAFKARFGYDPVTADHIEIQAVRPQMVAADW